jgi:hypothetical protein
MSYITLNGVNYAALPPQGTTTPLTGSYILDTDASLNIITDVSSDGNGLFITPFISRMYADASGSVGVLKQTTVEILDIDRIFNITLPDENAKKILKGFKVMDTDASGGVIYDPSANVSVDLIADASGDFKTALMTAIASADLSDGTVSLTNWLKSETQKDVTRLLNFDTLANLLEASVLTSFGINLDASGGASNMWTAMNAGGDGAARRRAMFTQLTESRVEKYATVDPSGLDMSNERVAILNFMPLVQGDKLAFVFDVIVGQYSAATGAAPTAGSLVSRVSNDAAIGTQGAYTDAYVLGGRVSSNFETGDLTIAKPTMRRIAVQLRLGNNSEAYGNAFPFTRSGTIAGGHILSLN